MKKNKIRLSAAVMALMPVLLLLVASSCKDDHDGDWDPMEWKVTNDAPDNIVKSSDNNMWSISSGKESTISFTCTNYDNPWLSGIELNNSYNQGTYWNPNFDDPATRNKFSTNWCTVKIKQNQLIVRFADNITPTPGYIDTDTIKVVVTAGDIFDYFQFIRKY